MGEIEFEEGIKLLAYGFRHEGEAIDMLDNEYLTLSLQHEYKKDQKEKYLDEIGLHECSHDTHLHQYYSDKTLLAKFGSIYCSNELNEHSELYGSSQLGYPTKRIKFNLKYCSNDYLKSIKSKKECKSREETWKWLDKLDMNAHFHQTFVDLNNIRSAHSVFHTQHNMMQL